jgi:hypothetical protein
MCSMIVGASDKIAEARPPGSGRERDTAERDDGQVEASMGSPSTGCRGPPDFTITAESWVLFGARDVPLRRVNGDMEYRKVGYLYADGASSSSDPAVSVCG